MSRIVPIVIAFAGLLTLGAWGKPSKAAKPSPKTAALDPDMAAPAGASAPAAPASPSAKEKGQAPEAPGNFYFPREALIGWAVKDAAAGDGFLETHQGDLNLTPGSTQKLFTTYVALDLLGGDKTYVTELFRAGKVEDGALKGDLIIRGGGDPSFGGAQFGPDHSAETIFAQWAQALRKEGIKRVEGCVIGEGGYLDEEGPHPASLWEDAGNYYAGTVSGLSFNDNLYLAAFSGASSAGRPVTLQGTLPVHSGIARFDNRLLTGPADGRDSAFIIGGFPAPGRILRGSYPAGRMPFNIKGSLPNPPWTCAREFGDYLSAHGIPAAAGSAALCGDSLAMPNHAPVAGAVAVPGARHVSPPLRELIRIVNQKSDNNFAAQVLALLGKGTGRSGDWRGGLEAVYGWLAARGFDTGRIHLKDGNGLSRYNWIAPAQTARLLAHAYRQKNFPEFQASLLGAPGATAKLERYGGGWEGKLYAKTGTLEGVSALAGYMKAASGKWIVFSIAANNFEAKNGDAQKYFAPLLRKWYAKY
ncbi:MAG: D-alanyl-D-alanine carboxypeptidase [Fibrobacteres bacterium]|nr:D-alanyl-D-alanine carboxypeptidase [Fibrobacterota bacterium]